MSLAAALVPALKETAAALTAAGVRTRLKRSEVNAPGGWLVPQTFEETALDGSGVCHAWLYLIAPAAQDGEDALATLAGLLDKTTGVLSPTEPVDVYDAVPLTATATFPAFRLSVDIDLEGSN